MREQRPQKRRKHDLPLKYLSDNSSVKLCLRNKVNDENQRGGKVQKFGNWRRAVSSFLGTMRIT